MTRGAEALPTLKIMEQETDARERSLIKELEQLEDMCLSVELMEFLIRRLAKNGIATHSTDVLFIREQIEYIEWVTTDYSKQNKLLSDLERDTGCISELKKNNK